MEIREIRDGDIDTVIEIWESRMGEGYADTEKLNLACTDGSPYAFVAEDNGGIVGFSIYRTLSKSELQAEVSPSLEGGGQQVALLDTNCVAKDREHEGIGSELVEVRLDHLDDAISEVYAISWIRESVKDSSVLFEKFGFSVVEEKEAYWMEDSLQSSYECVDCGSVCTCNAKIFRKVV